jgi:hypothetical protein
MGDDASATGRIAGLAKLLEGSGKLVSVSERRAALVVQCASELLGKPTPTGSDIHLPMSVSEFEQELRSRYAAAYPELVFRTDSTLERARLDRSRYPHLPRVVLRQGAPRRPHRR